MRPAGAQSAGIAVGWNPPPDARTICAIVELLVPLSDAQAELLRTTFEDRLRARFQDLDARLRREARAWEDRWGARMLEAVGSGRWGDGWMIQAARQEASIRDRGDDLPLGIMREVLFAEFSVFLTQEQIGDLEIALREAERVQRGSRMGLVCARAVPAIGAILTVASQESPDARNALRRIRPAILDRLQALRSETDPVIAAALSRTRLQAQRGLEFSAALTAAREARDAEANVRLLRERRERHRGCVHPLREAVDREESVLLEICDLLPDAEAEHVRRLWNMHRHQSLWVAGFLEDAAERRITALLGDAESADAQTPRDRDDEPPCTHALRALTDAVTRRQDVRAVAVRERRRWVRAFEEDILYYPHEYDAHVTRMRELCAAMAEAGGDLARALTSAMACEALDASLRAALNAVHAHLPAVPVDPASAVPDSPPWPGLADVAPGPLRPRGHTGNGRDLAASG